MNKIKNAHKKFNSSMNEIGSVFRKYRILLRDMGLPEDKVSQISLQMISLCFANILAMEIKRGVLKKEYLALFLQEQVHDEALSIFSEMEEKEKHE